MADEPSQEQLLAEQKAQCVFCKIVAGDVPSKKAYEDDRVLAILDINPAAKGHVLVLPKEHYPIMPLIPPDVFSALFGAAAKLSGAVAAGALAPRCTTFIANGGVAGQQSPHFLFHLIPREDGDALDKFSVPAGAAEQSGLEPTLAQNLQAVMREHLAKTGQAGLLNLGERVSDEAAKTPERRAQPSPTPGQLAELLEANPELKQLLITYPGKLKDVLAQNPEFRNLFAGVDIATLSEQLQGMAEAAPSFTPAPEAPAEEPDEPPPEDPSDPPAQEPVPRAAALSDAELKAFIDAKPKLKALLDDDEALRAAIAGSERLQAFFSGTDVATVKRRYAKRPAGLEDLAGGGR